MAPSYEIQEFQATGQGDAFKSYLGEDSVISGRSAVQGGDVPRNRPDDRYSENSVKAGQVRNVDEGDARSLCPPGNQPIRRTGSPLFWSNSQARGRRRNNHSLRDRSGATAWIDHPDGSEGDLLDFGTNPTDPVDNRVDHLSPTCLSEDVGPIGKACRIRPHRLVGIGEDLADLPAYSHPSPETSSGRVSGFEGAGTLDTPMDERQVPGGGKQS